MRIKEYTFAWLATSPKGFSGGRIEVHAYTYSQAYALAERKIRTTEISWMREQVCDDEIEVNLSLEKAVKL